MVISLVCGFGSLSQARTNTGQKRSGISAKFWGMARPVARVLTLLELLQSGGVRTVAELAGRLDADPQAEGGWLRVDLRAERLHWVPAVLASLDRPFVIERPDELRGLVIALADRLTASARAG
jgi:hypothetical protein